MKQFLFAFIFATSGSYCQSQSVHTFVLDSSHYLTYPDFSNTDTTLFIQYGDSLCILNQTGSGGPIYNFHFYVNDTTFAQPPGYFLYDTVQVDTILRIVFLNDTTCQWYGDNWGSVAILFNSPHNSLVVATGDNNFMRRFFFDYPYVSSIHEVSGSPDITIYPTPATNVLYVNGIGVHEKPVFSIYNITGSLMMTGGLVSHKIEIQNLPDGVYIINLNIDNYNVSRKFIKH